MDNIVLSINDEYYDILSNMSIGIIYVVNLLPLLKQRITTKTIISSLKEIFKSSQLSSSNITLKSKSVNNTLIEELILEEDIIRQCSSLINTVSLYHPTSLRYDIYEIIEVAYHKCHRTIRFVWSCFNKFILRLSEQPIINPLTIFILLRDKELVDEYLNNTSDIRINKFTAYKVINQPKYRICPKIIDKIRKLVLLRIFFYKEISINLNRDIYKYLLELELF